MIIDKNANIKINAANYKHYKQFFDNIKCGDLINVSIEQLNLGTDTKINVKCDICGNEKQLSYKMYLKNFSKYQKYSCCRKCAQFKFEKTSLEKYGTDNPSKSELIKNRIVESNNNNFGADYTFQSDEIKIKIKKTNIERYGCEYSQQNKEILEKSNSTNLKKYGTKRASENVEIKNKISQGLKKFWNSNLINNFNIISIFGNSYEMMCDCGEKHTFFIEKSLLNNRKQLRTKLCTLCNKINTGSGYQKELLEFIKTIYFKTILNNSKILNNYEIDIFLPDLNIGFEFNGLYWHSNIFLKKDYHYKKYIEAKEKNILLFQIWEDEWLSDKDNIISKIKNIVDNKNIIDKNILNMNNMKPYNSNILKDYIVVDFIKPVKYFVKNKKRFNKLEKYDFIVYDAGRTIFKKIVNNEEL